MVDARHRPYPSINGLMTLRAFLRAECAAIAHSACSGMQRMQLHSANELAQILMEY
jgi:hypothetical protein